MIPYSIFVWVLGAGTVLANPAPDPSARETPLWSLEPVSRPPVPEGDPTSTNPIDRFLDASHQKAGVVAVGRADKLTLLRRVALDLTGIPPTPAEQKAFVADSSPDAYEKVVDRMLASEQHAVRYARHWLDVLRYADSDERMRAASGIYLWRDWVIRALHDDLPYDEFVQVQLTGRHSDERSGITNTGNRFQKDPRPGDLFALGFLSRGAASSPHDLAINAVETVSTAFMGMTVGCAKCHDHMSDPISEQDFYSMKALFDPLVLREITLASAEDLFAAGRAQAEREKLRAPLERELADLLAPFKNRLYDERVAMLPEDVQAVIRKPEGERSVGEQKTADDYFPILRIDDGKIDEILPEDLRERARELRKMRDAAGRDLARNAPEIPVFHTVEIDRVREQEKSYILTSGDPERPELENEVNPGWPFSGGDYDFREGRVEAFADWLTAPPNPLFARVAVNRLWQWHFGEGLHKWPSDFGVQAGEPAHPDLLDWLASEFVARGYSMKAMHRLMVTSKVYQRSSETGAEFSASHEADPANTTLWHFPLRRLEAEPIWDAVQAAAGRLDVRVGGPSFRPGRPGRNRESGGTGVRRAAYMTRGFSASREVTPDFLQTFDVDDGRVPCPVRTRTVTAPQSLFLMNSPEIERASIKLAARVAEEAGDDQPDQVDLLYRLTLARPPSPAENDRALRFLNGEGGGLAPLAWLVFNLDEFIYVR